MARKIPTEDDHEHEHNPARQPKQMRMLWKWLMTGGIATVIGVLTAIATTSYTIGIKKSAFDAKLADMEEADQSHAKISKIQFERIKEMQKKLYDIEIKLIQVETRFQAHVERAAPN